MTTSLTVGKIYRVRIQRILTIGLVISTDDGKSGLIRTRELDWDIAGRPDWTKHYAVDELHRAKLIGWDGKRPLYSLRYAERDPWDTVSDRYEKNYLANGLVTGFDGPLAFIELEPGVTGSLHRSQLPSWNKGKIEEFLWLGDAVKVLVKEVNVTERKIDVTMQGLEKFRWSELPTERLESQHEKYAKPPSQPSEPARFQFRITRSILVVEDDEAQNRSLCNWLRTAGHSVESAFTEGEARSLLQSRNVEVVITDVGLIEGDGIHLTSEMMGSFPECQWILVTDWATAERRDTEIRSLENAGVVLLLKPLLPEELQTALVGVSKPLLEEEPKVLSTEKESTQPTIRPLRRRKKLEGLSSQILQILRQLQKSVRAGRAILFQLNVYQRRIDILSDTGQGGLNLRAVGGLIHSPVREIVDEGSLVRIDDIETVERYARNLRSLLSFRSCVGLPVRTSVSDRYALFMFHDEAGFVSERVIQEGTNVALALAARLDQRAALIQMTEIQRASLVGHLARGMVHEVNHHLQPIVWQLAGMRETSSIVEKEAENLEESLSKQPEDLASRVADISWNAKKLREEISSISNSIDNMAQTTNLFGRFTVQDKEQIVRVERIVEHSLDLIRDLADRAKITLLFSPAERLHLTRAKESQIQHILLNLLMNAVQQIEVTRPDQPGKVIVTVESSRDEDKLVVVTVEDDGPGIHQRLWEPIFQLGMTTRQGEGSGMGLYIAEHLADNLGGGVMVEQSFIGWGSRFLVEIPVRA